MTNIEMSPWLIATAATAPLILGGLAAWPFWRKRVTDDIGSIVGAGVVLTSAVGFVAREFSDVLATTAKCAAEEIPCHFQPEPFVRYAIYSGIGLLHVFVVFQVGLIVEERLRRKQGN